jgi:hypothetical protein
VSLKVISKPNKMPQSNNQADAPIGETRSYVMGKGFIRVDDSYDALIGHNDTKRLFAELEANPDRPEVRPQDAYATLLTSMQPGWTLRFLQIFWPDSLPRSRFQQGVEGWAKPNSEGLEIMREGLLLAIEESPLPFIRRTIIEYILPPNNEGLAWWGSIPGMCLGYGIEVAFLNSEEIQTLAQWVFNPSLE